jgi:hypothetical protein
MTTITFKNAMGIEMTNEIAKMNERLLELELYEIKRRRESEANPETMTTSKDITVHNEIIAIRNAYVEEKDRDFLTPVIEKLIADGAGDRIDALELIDTFMFREGSWNYCNRIDALDLDNSAEGFSIQFMTAFNKEVGPKY